MAKPNMHIVQVEAFDRTEMAPAKPAGFASDQLKSFIERLERLEEDKKAITDDIKDVFSEAKGTGFDVKIMKMVLRLRKQDKAEREEQQAILDLYLRALGMIFGGDPLMDDEDLVVTNLYDAAVALVRSENKASPSLLQRRLSVGFNAASALVERMESEGIVSPPNLAGKREILHRREDA